MMKIFLPLLFLSINLFAQEVKVPGSVERAMDRVDTQMIRSHIHYLADDKLKGRLPGTEGYQLATDYVVEQYKKIGLLPAGDSGSYLQKLVIRRSVLNNTSSIAVLKDDIGNIDSLSFVKDFVPVPHPLRSTVTGEGKLVFAGYGIEIPGTYSDYEGVNVKGKIVVVIAGAPSGLSSTLTSHFNNAGGKMSKAFEKGAVGIIMINPSARVSNELNPVVRTQVALDASRSKASGRGFTGDLDFAVNGTRNLLHRLFLNSGKSLDLVMASLRNKRPSSFELPLSMTISYVNNYSDFESHNIAGVFKGSDKDLKNEYIVHSAHLDHMGIGRAVNGDSIYNGAHDNASGVASLLEIARIYKTSAVKTKRSVLFLMVTGEEMGLLGSSYFAAHPTVPKNSIVANVNTDMPTVIAPLLSIVPLGAEHSTIMDHVKFAASRLSLGVEPDPEPLENRFIRSDQYSFVVNGIPALHVKYGTKSDVPGFDLVNFVKEWRAKYYHMPADGPDGIFNYAAAKTYVKLNFLISYSIAQTVKRPEWNKGDLFGVKPR
jgi:hypothetical protein